MKINRFLAGILALVLVAGFGTPAFGQETHSKNPDGGSISLPASVVEPSANPEIYNNGGPNDGVIFFTSCCIVVDDFVLEESTTLRDVHFYFQELTDNWDGTMEYFIFADDSGSIGPLIASGNGINVDREYTGFVGHLGPQSIFWFDLEEPVPLEAGVTYWLGLHQLDGFDFIPSPYGWESTDEIHGNTGKTIVLGDFNDIQDAGVDFAFILTGGDDIVGGELLSIDSTALILASAQSTSWMIPLVLSALGIGLFAVSRKSCGGFLPMTVNVASGTRLRTSGKTSLKNQRMPSAFGG